VKVIVILPDSANSVFVFSKLRCYIPLDVDITDGI